MSGDYEELKAAAERVGEWRAQFRTLRGLDQETAHVANYAPLFTADVDALLAAVADLAAAEADAERLADALQYLIEVTKDVRNIDLLIDGTDIDVDLDAHRARLAAHKAGGTEQ